MDDRVAPADRVSAPLPAILLCGGRGTRLADAPSPASVDASADPTTPTGDPADATTVTAEKPLVRVDDEPMVDRVIRALRRSDTVGTIHAVASPHTSETLEHLRSVADRGVGGADRTTLTALEGSGDGYVADLQAALADVGRPAVTVVADLPLLRAEHVSAAVDHARRNPERESLTVCVPAATKRDLGVSLDTTMTVDGTRVAPTGLNVVGCTDAGEDVRIVDDPALAVNVNRPGDLAVARRRS
ncbi:NTP transferase domain-containing protein [Halopenitus persicus]|uniref:NTP transferase domain-containing protein n=1 Tax=Halopenitus persicus TaxID=1048396 RepID=UPI001E41F858|nr:NTP transferase domain-containing protein [Halopenitus persicus]